MGLAEKRPILLLTVFDGEDAFIVERDCPTTPKFVADKECKWCKHPEKVFVSMDEIEYGKNAILCCNCERLNYQERNNDISKKA